MAERKGKGSIIYLSSSEEEEGEDDDPIEKCGISTQSDDEEEEEEDQSDGDETLDCGGDDESHCNRVVRFLRERSDLEVLSLSQCKAYLRKNGLRIAGEKAVCIQRIKDHWRMRNCNIEALYPRSSFFINCTGDVCKGDVVLFTQKVYDKFNKVSRHGKVQGTRTIAGRVVKESYGAEKQQHTFTIEVLWSTGIRKLPLLFPLLVKGRNLYKLRTFRRGWTNEAERIKVLAEKHKRGSAARLARARKKNKMTLSTKGAKLQKSFHHPEPFQTRKTSEAENRKHVRSINSSSHRLLNVNNQPVTHSRGRVNMKHAASSSKVTESYHGYPRVTRPKPHQSYADHPQNSYQSQMNYQHKSVPPHPTSYMTRIPPIGTYTEVFVPPSSQQGFNFSHYPNRAYPNSSYGYDESSNMRRFPF